MAYNLHYYRLPKYIQISEGLIEWCMTRTKVGNISEAACAFDPFEHATLKGFFLSVEICLHELLYPFFRFLSAFDDGLKVGAFAFTELLHLATNFPRQCLLGCLLLFHAAGTERLD